MEKYIYIFVKIRTEGKRIMTREARAGRRLSPHWALRPPSKDSVSSCKVAVVSCNELAVHFVTEVAERDGLAQPEIFHHLQAGKLDVARAVAGVCSVLPRAVRPTGTEYRYVDSWTLYLANAKAAKTGMQSSSIPSNAW
jgi:hypothetical protein